MHWLGENELLAKLTEAGLDATEVTKKIKFNLRYQLQLLPRNRQIPRRTHVMGQHRERI